MVRRTQDARRRETREKLIEAAVKVLATRGYANFRIADVAEMSGVSHGGMIHHYPSKDALITAVLGLLVPPPVTMLKSGPAIKPPVTSDSSPTNPNRYSWWGPVN